MKKFYFLGAIALSTSFLSAQVLESNDFNSLTNGNVGTNTTFGAPGQAGIYTNGGANSDYQIVDIDVAHGKSFQISSGSTNTTASNRQAVKPGLGTAWGTRTAGNDILQAKFEIYTGTASGATRVGANVTAATGGIVGIHYNSETKTLNGQASLTPAAGGAAGFYNITGITTNVYPANTWISVAFTYDSVNGVITYTIDGVKNTLSIGGYNITKNLLPSQYNLINQISATNAALNTGAIDNYVVSAENAATLATGAQANTNVKLSLYPNPTSDFLNFSAKITSVEIFDAVGRKVSATKAVNNQVDVRNLAKGVYMVKFETENGTQTQKFIKK